MLNFAAMKRKRTIYFSLLAIMLTACDDVFQTHPYDVNFDGETSINAINIATIESRFANKDTMRVAFISDTHGWYSDAKSISLFYEISSCDLYIRSKIQDRSVSLKDILGLSLGIKFQAF